MLRSMTGFGEGEAALGASRIVLELRSLNHRHLDVRVRMPRELLEHNAYVEQLVRGRITRGRIEVGVRFEGGGPALTVDRRRAEEVLRALREVRDSLGMNEPVPLSVLAAVPDLFVLADVPEHTAVRASLSAAFDRAINGWDTMRSREGAHLLNDLRTRLTAMRSHATELQQHAPRLVDLYRARLRERIAKLLSEHEAHIHQERLEHEVAVYADHADVSEELTRLDSHLAQLEMLLASEEPVGRRADFLLQEVAREANTLGAKAVDAQLTLRVVELKAEVERMREQIQNVE